MGHLKSSGVSHNKNARTYQSKSSCSATLQHHLFKSLLGNSGENENKEKIPRHTSKLKNKVQFNSDQNDSLHGVNDSPPNSASGITDIIPNLIECDDDDDDTSSQVDQNDEVVSDDKCSFQIAHQSQARWEELHDFAMYLAFSKG